MKAVETERRPGGHPEGRPEDQVQEEPDEITKMMVIVIVIEDTNWDWDET